MQNIVPSHLADNGQFDFRGLTLDTAVEEGDIAFDPPELPVNTDNETNLPMKFMGL
jgi:tRNA 2-thiocytidine biosynthesis protein TtcA